MLVMFKKFKIPEGFASHGERRLEVSNGTSSALAPRSFHAIARPPSAMLCARRGAFLTDARAAMARQRIPPPYGDD